MSQQEFDRISNAFRDQLSVEVDEPRGRFRLDGTDYWYELFLNDDDSHFRIGCLFNYPDAIAVSNHYGPNPANLGDRFAFVELAPCYEPRHGTHFNGLEIVERIDPEREIAIVALVQELNARRDEVIEVSHAAA